MPFSPAVVQTTTDYATTSEELQFVLGAEPTQGNLLVVGAYVLSTSRTILSPSGWTAIRNFSTSYDDFVVFYKIAGSAEGTTFDFPVDSAGALKRGSMVEYSGIPGSIALDTSSINPLTSAATTLSTGTTGTVSTTDALGIAFFAPKENRTSLPTNGYTIDAEDNSAGTDVKKATLCSKHVTDGTAQESSISIESSDRSGAILAVFVESGGADHALDATDIQSATSVSSPSISQVHDLTANDVSSQTNVSSPTLTQKHSLDASNVQSATSVSAPTLSETHILDASNVESASSVSSPALSQAHSLDASNIQSVTSVSNPTITQVHSLNANDLSSATQVSNPSLSSGVDHSLSAQDVQSASSVTTPTLKQTHGLQASSVSSLTETSIPQLQQVHDLTGQPITSATEVSSPSLNPDANAVSSSDIQLTGILISELSFSGTIRSQVNFSAALQSQINFTGGLK